MVPTTKIGDTPTAKFGGGTGPSPSPIDVHPTLLHLKTGEQISAHPLSGKGSSYVDPSSMVPTTKIGDTPTAKFGGGTGPSPSPIDVHPIVVAIKEQTALVTKLLADTESYHREQMNKMDDAANASKGYGKNTATPAGLTNPSIIPSTDGTDGKKKDDGDGFFGTISKYLEGAAAGTLLSKFLPKGGLISKGIGMAKTAPKLGGATKAGLGTAVLGTAGGYLAGGAASDAMGLDQNGTARKVVTGGAAMAGGVGGFGLGGLMGWKTLGKMLGNTAEKVAAPAIDAVSAAAPTAAKSTNALAGLTNSAVPEAASVLPEIATAGTKTGMVGSALKFIGKKSAALDPLAAAAIAVGVTKLNGGGNGESAGAGIGAGIGSALGDVIGVPLATAATTATAGTVAGAPLAPVVGGATLIATNMAVTALFTTIGGKIGSLFDRQNKLVDGQIKTIDKTKGTNAIQTLQTDTGFIGGNGATGNGATGTPSMASRFMGFGIGSPSSIKPGSALAKTREAGMAQAATAAGITDPKEHASFMGQMSHESGGFGAVKENISDDKANKDYAGKNGNNMPGDGARYKGRGFVQLTGKGNYADMSKNLQQQFPGIDLVKNPELMEQDAVNQAATIMFWKKSGAGKYAKAGDLENVSKSINGTNKNTGRANGADDRTNRTYQYLNQSGNGGVPTPPNAFDNAVNSATSSVADTDPLGLSSDRTDAIRRADYARIAGTRPTAKHSGASLPAQIDAQSDVAVPPTATSPIKKAPVPSAPPKVLPPADLVKAHMDHQIVTSQDKQKTTEKERLEKSVQTSILQNMNGGSGTTINNTSNSKGSNSGPTIITTGDTSMMAMYNMFIGQSA
jgi:putative chitinase